MPLLLRRFLADYGRNRANLLLLVVVPVTFVLVASPALADASRLLGGAGGGPAIETVTAGWAAAFLAAVAMYFQVSGARFADRRLVLAGMPRGRLAAARVLTGVVLAVLASLAAMLALVARGDVSHPWRVAVGTLLFALVYVGLGAAVGATVPNAVNGTVVLLFIWILDVFFGPTLSGTQSPVVRLLPTHFVSLWTVDLPSGHTGPSELAWSLMWAAGALLLATIAVLGRRPHPAVAARSARPAASLRTGLRMGWRDWRRTPVLWALLAVVPAVFILLSKAITPHGRTPVALRENGITRIAIVDPAEMHAGTMAPIAVASLATLVGVFVVLDSREGDRRLALAGARRTTVAATRLLLVLFATGVATTISLLVTAAVFDAAQWGVYAVGNALVAATYAFVGMLLGPVFGRVSSVFLAFLIPFLDLGIWQSPMLRGEPAGWAHWLPGYGGIRIVIDGALTAHFDEATSLAAALGWLTVLGLAAAVAAAPRVVAQPTSGAMAGVGTGRPLTAPAGHRQSAYRTRT